MSAVRIGVDGLKFPGAAERGAVATLVAAHELGAQGVFYRSVLEVTPTLDPGPMAELRQEADRRGMYLEVGLGKINPYAAAEAPGIRDAGEGDTILGCRRLMESAAAIDCREMWVGLANKKPRYPRRLAYDRFRTDVTWEEQLRATERVLRQLAPVARDLGIHLNIETHEEITTFEVLRLVESVGEDVIGIVLDTSNPLQRMEHPVRAAERVAPYVRQSHFKDAFLGATPDGLRYQVRSCGEGVIDFGAVLRVVLAANPGLNLTLETRPPDADFPQPGGLPTIIEIDDEGFRAAHPDLGESELAEFRGLVAEARNRLEQGDLAGPATIDEAAYGAAEAVASITASTAHLRSCLARIVTEVPR